MMPGEDLLQLDLMYEKNESTSAIFVLPNEGSGISIVSSTSAISDAHLVGTQLTYEIDKAGTQIIRWPSGLGKPIVKENDAVDFRIESQQDGYLVKITTRKNQKTSIQVESNR